MRTSPLRLHPSRLVLEADPSRDWTTTRFEITLPEKTSSIEVSHNGRPAEGKGKASANASARSLLPGGGPPSSFRGASASVEHLLEAVVVYAHEGDSETVNTEPVDARGHRVARELESVERVTFEVGPDVQAMMHALEGRGDAALWKKEIDVKGGPEGKVIAILDVTVSRLKKTASCGGGLTDLGTHFSFRFNPLPFPFRPRSLLSLLTLPSNTAQLRRTPRRLMAFTRWPTSSVSARSRRTLPPLLRA